jgi:3-hydroxyisobutyrate dehydrogenase-like beta-hydroxyacid dehydrogenase
VNFNIVAAIESMAEAFTLAVQNGIPRAKMAELLSETLFSGVAYKGYGDHVARHEYEPARLSIAVRLERRAPGFTARSRK